MIAPHPETSAANAARHHPRLTTTNERQVMTQHSYTGLHAYLARQEEDYGHLGAKTQRTGKTSASKATSTARPIASRPNPLAGMSAVDILRQLSTPQRAGLAAALATPATAGTSKRDPEAEYLRGVANGRAAERTRIGKVYDNAKVMGDDAGALRMLATTDLDSTAINAKLFGADTSLADNMRARHGLPASNNTANASNWGDIHAEVAKDRGQ